MCRQDHASLEVIATETGIKRSESCVFSAVHRSRIPLGIEPAFLTIVTLLRHPAVQLVKPRACAVQRVVARRVCPGGVEAYRESYRERTGNKRICETTVGMTRTMLLAERRDMDHILEAIRKVHAHSAALAKSAGRGPRALRPFRGWCADAK
jgi:hypothetical protein